jgi:hypothetical protein
VSPDLSAGRDQWRSQRQGCRVARRATIVTVPAIGESGEPFRTSASSPINT